MEKVANFPGVFSGVHGVDFLEQPIREECERLIPNADEISPNEWTDAYLYVRENFSLSL